MQESSYYNLYIMEKKNNQQIILQKRIVLDEESLIEFLQEKSPNLKHFFTFFIDLYRLALQKKIQEQQFKAKVRQLFKTLKYESRKGPIIACNQKIVTGYYHCSDCSSNLRVGFCEDCFQEKRHMGHHYFFNSYPIGSKIVCNCGDLALLPADGWCGNHKVIEQQILDEREQQQIENEFEFLLMVGIIILANEEQLSNKLKQVFFEEVICLIQRLVTNSLTYQQLISRVVLGHKKYSFLSFQTSILKLLLGDTHLFDQDFSFSEELDKKNIQMLYQLCQFQHFKQQLFGTILAYSEFNLYLKQNRRVLLKGLIEKTVPSTSLMIESYMYSEKLRLFIVRQNVQNYELCLLMTQIHSSLLKTNPELYLRLFFTLVDRIQIQKFFDMLSYTSQQSKQVEINMIFSEFTFLLFRQMNKSTNKTNQRYKCLKMLIKSLFVLIKAKHVNHKWVCRYFTLSVISLLDCEAWFNNEGFENSLLSKLELDYSDYSRACTDAQLIQKIVLDYFYSLEINNSAYNKNAFKTNLHLSIDYSFFEIMFQLIKEIQLSKQMHSNIIETHFKKIEFVQLAKKMKKQQLAKNTEEQLLKILQFLNGYSLMIESNVFKIVVMNEINEELCIKQTALLFGELAYISKNKSRLQFRDVLRQWSRDEKLIKKFIIQDFMKIKNENENVESSFTNLSMYSLFGRSENEEQRKKRFIFKFNLSNSQTVNLKKVSLFQVQVEQLMDIFEQFVDKYIKSQEKIINNAVVETVNSYFNLLITKYLQNRNNKTLNTLNKIYQNTNLSRALKPINKQVFMFLQQQIDKKQNFQMKAIARQNTKQRAKQKKQKKIKQMRQKQNQFLEANQIKPLESSAHDNCCIICKLSQEKEPVQILCYVGYSRELTRTIKNPDKSILLFTTCGHKVHQSCFSANLKGNQNFKSSYSCYLCKKLSNIRIPIKTDSIEESYITSFYQNIETIISNYNQNLRDNFKLEKQQQIESMLEMLFLKDFSDQIYTSVVYQIYFYYLSHSQLFISFMLPIFQFLLKLLKFYLPYKSINCFTLTVQSPDYKDKIRKIEENVLLILYGEIQSIKFLYNEAKLYKNEDEIDDLFMSIIGQKDIQMKTVKKLANFQIYRPPLKLVDLKKMAAKCPQCCKSTDNIQICLSCGYSVCTTCQSQWNYHRQKAHRGNLASIFVSDGKCYYESLGTVSNGINLYRNYLGEPYQNNSVQSLREIEQQCFELDVVEYQRIVEDIVVEGVYCKCELLRLN